MCCNKSYISVKYARSDLGDIFGIILIILRKYNLQVYELPITWIHKDGSKINLIKDSIKMIAGLIRLKINYRL